MRSTQKENFNVWFLRSENNPTDAFTKLTKCPPLRYILTENVADLQGRRDKSIVQREVPLEQWLYVIEDDSRDLKTAEC